MGMSAIRCGDYEDCRDCDLIIITAGQNRKVGETKLDLAKDNVEVLVVHKRCNPNCCKSCRYSDL